MSLEFQSTAKRPVGASTNPKDRNLKQAQIGYSSHENEYTVNTNVGNWVEQKMASTANTTLPQSVSTYNYFIYIEQTYFCKQYPLEYTSMNATMYRNPTEVDPHVFHNRRDPIITPELGGKILFSPNIEQDVSYYSSIGQLSMTGGKNALKTEQVLQIKDDTSVRKRDLLQQKREQWHRQIEEESDINETFTTTNKNHFKEANANNTLNLASTSTLRQKNTTELGAFMRFSNSDFQKSALRGKSTIF